MRRLVGNPKNHQERCGKRAWKAPKLAPARQAIAKRGRGKSCKHSKKRWPESSGSLRHNVGIVPARRKRFVKLLKGSRPKKAVAGC